MKAMAVTKRGSSSALMPMELPEPDTKAGQVRVRVHAASINPADAKVLGGDLTGRMLHASVSPLVPGYDFSGVIDQVGPDVEDLKVGDAVFGHLAYGPQNRQGTMAERVVVNAADVARKPVGVDHAVAAASATVGLTALQALRDLAKVQPGHEVLVLGAAGGVGSLAVGIAKRLGANVTAVCSDYALDFVRGLGADVVVDRKARDPLAHDHTFDAIFDTTGLYPYRSCRKLLKPQGAFVTTLPSPAWALGKASALFGGPRCEMVIVRSRQADLEQLGRWVAEGLPVPIAERFPAREVSAAFERLAQGRLLGKVAVAVEGGLG